MPLTPNNRNEAWMKGMVDGSTTLEPNNRREHWYKEIVDAIGSGGGGGGGGAAAVISATDIPYLAQAMQTALTAATNKGATSYANQSFYYSTTADNENTIADINTLISFLTENEGKATMVLLDGEYAPINYSASLGYVGVGVRGYNPLFSIAYNFDVTLGKHIVSNEIVGAYIRIWGTVTTNLASA